jgi:hypothetical protein
MGLVAVGLCLFARAQIFGAFLYPLALTLQLPVYIYVMVLEKESRLRQMQLSMGLKLDAYYAVNFAYNMALYTGIAAFFWLAGAAVKLRFFVQASRSRALQRRLSALRCVHCSAREQNSPRPPGVPFSMRSACTGQTAWTTLLVLLVGWGLALVATGFLLSAVLSRSAGRTRTHAPARDAMRGYGRGALLRGASPWGRRRSLPPECAADCAFRLQRARSDGAWVRRRAVRQWCGPPPRRRHLRRPPGAVARRPSVCLSRFCLSLLRPARAPCR